MKSKSPASFEVSISNDEIVWTNHSDSVIKIPIEKIKLIGEFTNAEGPYYDDWFVVFMVEKNRWYEISVYTNGCEKVMTELGKYFESDFKLSLANSTQWKSKIIWPEKIRGNEIWNIIETPPKNFSQKIKKIIGIASNEEIILTKEAEMAFQ